MNIRLLLTLVFLGAAALLALPLARNHRRLAALQAERRTLPAAPVVSGAGATAPAVSAPLTPEETLELMRLRAEVARLRRERRALGALPVASRPGPGTVAGPAAVARGLALPPDYVRSSQAAFRGFNTPEDALESFVWALRHGDTNALVQSLSSEHAADAVLSIAANPAELASAGAGLPGFRIRERQAATDDEVVFLVEIIPGEVEQPMRLVREAGQWRMKLP